MSDNVLPFRKPRSQPSLKARARGRTLCQSGFHKWQIDQKKQFDVKQGKLVTIERCIRCDAVRTEVR